MKNIIYSQNFLQSQFSNILLFNYIIKFKLSFKFNYFLNNFFIFIEYFKIFNKKYSEKKIYFNKNYYKIINIFFIYYIKTNKLFNFFKNINYNFKLKSYLFKNLFIFKYLINICDILFNNFNIISYNKFNKYINNILNTKCKINFKILKILNKNKILDFKNNCYMIKNKNILLNLFDKNNIKFIYIYNLLNLNKNIIKNIINNIIISKNNIINNIIYNYIYNIINNNNINKKDIINIIYNINLIYNNKINLHYYKYIKKLNKKKLLLNTFIINILLNNINLNNIIYNFNNIINKFIFGQNIIIKKLSNYLIKFNLKNLNKPIGSFLLCGSSGTGKTEFAKLLSEYIYKTNKNLIHLDMSEYMEPHSISKLIGTPPGYKGYENEGFLITKIKNKPNSIILFDEIEKAHKNIYPIFLQILDEGILTNSKGTTINFYNSLILFTSNLGSNIFNNISNNKLFNIKYYNKIKLIINDYFKPEFINRLDDIIIFNPLLPVYLYLIIDKILYNKKYICLNITKNIKSLFSLISYSPKQGSRFILNNLEKIIEISNKLNINLIKYNNKKIKYILFKKINKND
uniref:ATP-dependent Clp protease 2 n=1 Tax=Babesia duncani TaxID=323732 RepID=A0A385GNK5_9APIC|nr:ATP-dependent Clp protease 2 [Babesia duncani]